jgi:sigma-B regulation protein RsbU (phosphoserine phosphatase)
MMATWEEGVGNSQRIAAVERSGLFGTDPEDAFDRLTELAALLTGAPRACITLVDANSYNYKSATGVPADAARFGRIEDSFCRYVVGSGRPLVVENAVNDERTRDNPAIELNNVGAWAGYPIEDGEGAVLGTFCIVDTKPHEWTDTDLYVLATLAMSASSEFALYRARAVIASARQETSSLRTGAEGIITALAVAEHESDPRVVKEMELFAKLARNVDDTLGGIEHS